MAVKKILHVNVFIGGNYMNNQKNFDYNSTEPYWISVLKNTRHNNSLKNINLGNLNFYEIVNPQNSLLPNLKLNFDENVESVAYYRVNKEGIGIEEYFKKFFGKNFDIMMVIMSTAQTTINCIFTQNFSDFLIMIVFNLYVIKLLINCINEDYE